MPRKVDVHFKDPKTGEVSKVKLWGVDAKDAVKRVPWEYSFNGQFADRPKEAPDPHAKPDSTPLDHRQPPLQQPAEPPVPVSKQKDEKLADKPKASDDLVALRKEYEQVLGKKAPGFLKADKLRAAIDKAKAENSSAGGGAQSGSGDA